MISWDQIGLMVLQAVIISVFLIVLFKLRRYLGLSLLYIALGVFQYLQTLLALAVYIEVVPGVLISPGSAVLFTASFFTILLVYIREDAVEARKLCYGILAANLITSLLAYLFGLSLKSPATVNFYGLPIELFMQNARVMAVGVVVLALDVVLIIVIYEGVSRLFKGWLFLRVLASMLVVLAFDTVLFITGGFLENPDYVRLLLSGILGKSAAALLYSAVLTVYLRVFERERAPAVVADSRFRDVFQLLTFREKYQVLQEQIKRDPLTGIYNRGFFNYILPREVSLAGRMRFSLALIMLDIDRFKKVNDQYGHRTGDVVLQEMAALLGRSIRSSDILCRYGGEEFAILLPNTTVSAALVLAQKLRKTLKENPVAQKVLAKGHTVTATMGVAAYPDDASSPEALVESADQRLYQGKEAGRDRVVGPPSY